MRRTALSAFFRRLIVTTLPLAGCGGAATPMRDAAVTTPQDLAVVVPADMTLPSPDLYDSCDVTYPVVSINNQPSNLPDGGFQTQCLLGSWCESLCPSGYMLCCAPRASDGGATLVDCSRPCPGGGRRPEGLATASGGDELGDYFAAMAHLEAASVTAFRRLGRELRVHGAPARLIDATRRAASDEIRHARMLRRFAWQHGRAPAPVQVTRFVPRSLEDVARENVAEGCVRETFGALVASWQARAAADRGFAAVMSTIARDETRHAELSWSVDEFCRARLLTAARRRVRRARAQATEALASELATAWPASVAARVGLPDAASTQRLFESTRRALWS